MKEGWTESFTNHLHRAGRHSGGVAVQKATKVGCGEFENLWEFRPMVGVRKALGSLDSGKYLCAQNFGTLKQKLGDLNPPG